MNTWRYFSKIGTILKWVSADKRNRNSDQYFGCTQESAAATSTSRVFARIQNQNPSFLFIFRNINKFTCSFVLFHLFCMLVCTEKLYTEILSSDLRIYLNLVILAGIIWPWALMLLLLRDYATFDYAKWIRDFGARLCYLYASIIGYATLGPFPFAIWAPLC